MFELREITLLSIIIRILASIVLGGILGIERGLKNRPAGLRTYMLVCMGSCIIMLTNQYVVQVLGSGDPVRMGAQVVSGIGFLGAGTIIVTRRNQIKGLTTAAGLWAAAAVGLAIGIGFYEAAVIGGLMIFTVLTLLHNLDFKMRQTTKIMDAYIELKRKSNIGAFIRFAKENNIEVSNVQMESEGISASDAIGFVVTLKSLNKKTHAEITVLLRGFDDIKYFEEL